MMEQRVNKVKGIFAEYFGLTPDVIDYKEGKIEAFRIIPKGEDTLILVVKEKDYNSYDVEVTIDKQKNRGGGAMKRYITIEIYRHYYPNSNSWYYDYRLEMTDELHGLSRTKKKIDTTREYDKASVYHKFSSDPYIAGWFDAYWIKRFNLLIVQSSSRIDCYTIENDELKECDLPDNCIWTFRNDIGHYGYDLYDLATDTWVTEFSK